MKIQVFGPENDFGAAKLTFDLKVEFIQKYILHLNFNTNV